MPGLSSREARSRKRKFLQDTAKQIDHDNAIIAHLRTDLIATNAQLEAHSIQKGKRVRIDPNIGFTNVEEFEAARVEKEAAMKREAERAKLIRAKYDLNARKAYKEIKYIPFGELYTK